MASDVDRELNVLSGITLNLLSSGVYCVGDPKEQRVTPRQDRAKQYLLDAIASGEFGIGNVVPAADILAKKARCSEGTIQSALNVLAQEGIVKRVRRLGTLVTRQPATKRVCLMMAL